MSLEKEMKSQILRGIQMRSMASPCWNDEFRVLLHINPFGDMVESMCIGALNNTNKAFI